MDIETYYKAHQGLKDFTSTLMDLVVAELTNIDKDYNCKKQFYLIPYVRDLANLLDVEIKSPLLSVSPILFLYRVYESGKN